MRFSASSRSSASACGTVRGKPSRMKPFAASGCSTRWPSMRMMMSSDTSCPASITAFASRPIGEPAATSARSMSPVEICAMP